MTIFIKVFSCLGLLSPESRGALMTVALVSYFLLGILAGFISARMYKMFGGKQCLINALMNALLCPG